jgi:ribosomal protein S18 acetylase RimI-like enzyme
MELVPASDFTYEQLAEAYNQTRVDYLVPMPMNAARLQEYVRVNDVDLNYSVVAMENGFMLGLGLLGRREDRTWITRLGVLPSGRRRGVGQAIMDELLRHSNRLNVNRICLEVIKGNLPALTLFCKLGFCQTRELIIARRAPDPNAAMPSDLTVKSVTPMNHEDAIILLSHRQTPPNWLNEVESLSHVRNLSALVVETAEGGRGWVTYHAGLLQLTRVIVEVTAGDPVRVTTAVLHTLHQRHKRQDTITENILDDQTWQGFREAGYFEAFRRIEMLKPQDPQSSETEIGD